VSAKTESASPRVLRPKRRTQDAPAIVRLPHIVSRIALADLSS
jgi:hypothetical protein